MRVSSRNHTDQINLKHSRSSRKQGKDAVSAGHTDEVPALSAAETMPLAQHTAEPHTSGQHLQGWAAGCRAYCPGVLIRSADPA